MDDKFLKVMTFGAVPKARRFWQRHPYVAYSLIGFELGFFGYNIVAEFREYFRLEREENERHQKYREYWTERTEREMKATLDRINADFQAFVDETGL